MKASELRIGNWLKYTDEPRIKTDKRDKPFQVIIDDIVVLSEFNIDHIVPIPLTEDWLLKLGFTKSFNKILREAEYDYDTDKMHIVIRKDYDRWCVHIDDDRFCSLVGGVCEYVHQLQNLVIDVTGEEI